jgi:outer membrane lipoprotein-sorting protein
MGKAVIAICLLLTAFPGKSQYAGYKLLANDADFKEKFSAASQKTNSIKSDFLQEKNISLLSEKIVSKGKFWFKKDAMVRMEYVEPFQYLMILNNGKVLVRDGQKENKLNSRSNKLFRQINDIIVDCVRGSAMQNPDFNVRVFDGRSGYLMELTPKTKNLNEYFKNILVTLDKNDYSAASMEMNEQSGDNTVIHFSNKELNATIPDALFAIH